MLGLSLSKILVLLAIILVVWYGFKWLARVEAIRRAQVASRRRGNGDARQAPAEAEDMVKCPSCGAYSPLGRASACGRADCPYP